MGHPHKLYLLTDSHLDETPGWQAAAADFELVRDFGKEFADVRQIAVHWYGGGNYPHYLYRRRPAPLPGETVVEK